MLLACKGVVGFHVGRSADMDAELLFFLTAFMYHFVNHLFFAKHKHAILWGIFLSLGFLLKTTDSLLYIPGIFLYLILSKQLVSLLKDRWFWLGAGTYLFTLASWFVIVQVCGATYTNTAYAGENAWQTMIIYDTWMRFTASHFDGHPVEQNWMFFFHTLDSRFNIWNYLAFGGIALFLFGAWKKGRSFVQEAPFLLFSLCIVIPPALLLTFGMHKLDWYASPTLLFLAVFAAYLESAISKSLPYFRWVFSAVLLFALVRHFLFLQEANKESTHTQFLSTHKGLFKTQQVICLKNVPSNVYTWLMWQGYDIQLADQLPLDTKGRPVIGQRALDETIDSSYVVKADYQYQSYPTITYIAEKAPKK